MRRKVPQLARIRYPQRLGELTRSLKTIAIEEEIARLVPILHLEEWHFAVLFYNTRGEVPLPEEQCGAACKADPEYKQATLVFVLDEIPPDLLRETVLHELLHAPLWEATKLMDRYAGGDEEKQDRANEATERITNHFTTVLDELLNGA